MLAALALLLTLGTAVASPAAEAAGPGEYGAPEWYPLRGTSTVGCTFGGGCSGHHSYFAIDLMQAKGSPVYAAGAGQVTRVDNAGACGGSGYGRMVEVNHGGGVSTRYAHLDTTAVTVGTWVDQNTRLGTVGATGSVSSCTAYHLHFERWVNGARVAPNPMKACNGTTYPNAWGYSSWGSVPAHTRTITSTGTCGAPTPPPIPPGWQGVAGTLVQMDFGPDGQIWGVNAGGTIYQYAGNGSWTARAPGSATSPSDDRPTPVAPTSTPSPPPGASAAPATAESPGRPCPAPSSSSTTDPTARSGASTPPATSTSTPGAARGPSAGPASATPPSVAPPTSAGPRSTP